MCAVNGRGCHLHEDHLGFVAWSGQFGALKLSPRRKSMDGSRAPYKFLEGAVYLRRVVIYM